jgi:hypothetical protein
MNKTKLRASLAKAVRSARSLKTYGLAPQYYWSASHMLVVADELEKAARDIRAYVECVGRGR